MRRADWLAAAVLAALCLLLHGRAVTFGFTGTDDTLQVVDDAVFLGDVSNIAKAFGRGLFAVSGAQSYYRPVVTLSYMADAQWAGPQPGAYHATNVLLHAATVVLLFAIARRLLFARDVAFLMAAVFTVHPSTAEAASWIPARGDVLLGAWLAGMFVALLRFRETRALPALAAHLGLLVLAFFTKENAVLLPLAFAAYGLFVDRDRTWIRDRRLWIGWAAGLLVWLVTWRTVMAEHVRGAPGLGAAVKNAPTLLQCLGQALNPFHPAVLAGATDTPWLPGVLALAGLAFAAWRLDGERRRLLLWGAGTFLLLLVPSLPVSDFLILEHRLYAPWLGLFVAGLAILERLAAARAGAGRRVVLGFGGALVVLLALLSFDYASAFRDAEAFTEQAVRSSPGSSLARLSRGTRLQGAGRLDEAQAEYEAALRANPKQLRAHLNLGSIRHQRGDLDGAEQLFRQELALNPGDDLATYNLAVVLMRRGQPKESERWLLETVRLNPRNAHALRALGEYAVMQGDTAAAARYRQALRSAGGPP